MAISYGYVSCQLYTGGFPLKIFPSFSSKNLCNIIYYMSGGTGISALGAPLPNDSGASLLKSAYPIDTPNSMGGETFKYESRGGYIPDTSKRASKHASRTPRSSRTPKTPKTIHKRKHKGGSRGIKKSRKSRKTRKNRTRRSYR